MTPVEIRNMNTNELVKLLEEKKRTLMNLRFQNALGELKDTSLLQKTRRDIARINTILRERELGIRR